MELDDTLRERLILVGGKVAGAECPNCGFYGRDVDFESHTTEGVNCPDCGTPLLTAEEKSQLRRANKF